MIHDDGDALDLLTRVFEADGFEVVAAVTGFRALAHLEGDRSIAAVIAPWDAARAVGGEVYRWALQHRYDLRDRFVFLAEEVPAEFDRLVAGRCLAVPPADPDEIVRVARAAVRQRAQLEAAQDQAAAAPAAGRPTLLLAEDDPTLLAVMSDLLTEAGYAVTRAEGSRAAIRVLEVGDFDAIVADLRMGGGSGAELFRWLRTSRPHLAERVVFLAGEEGAAAAAVAPGRPVFRKGSDSRGLVDALREIVRRVRGQPPA